MITRPITPARNPTIAAPIIDSPCSLLCQSPGLTRSASTSRRPRTRLGPASAVGLLFMISTFSCDIARSGCVVSLRVGDRRAGRGWRRPRLELSECAGRRPRECDEARGAVHRGTPCGRVRLLPYWSRCDRERAADARGQDNQLGSGRRAAPRRITRGGIDERVRSCPPGGHRRDQRRPRALASGAPSLWHHLVRDQRLDGSGGGRQDHQRARRGGRG